MTWDQLKERARELPLDPGVYLMKDGQQTVIYVGKAKALRHRVSQYFQDGADHDRKTGIMVGQIDHFEVILANSEFEALVLECALIKRYQPKYNILLKDGKGYPYIRLSKEAYPRFSLVGKAAQDGARYFGPYASRHKSWELLHALRSTLRLPSCGRMFPRDCGKERPCLNFHMGLCDGYCQSEELSGQHQQAIAQAISLLEGRFAQVKETLSQEMMQAAQTLQFERAAQLRDRIRALEALEIKQQVVSGSLADTDVVGFVQEANRGGVVFLHYQKGELTSKDVEVVKLPLEGEREEVLSALLIQYYTERPVIPKQILLPCELPNQIDMARLFSRTMGFRVELVTPQRGAKMDLIQMAQKNAREEVERRTTREERQHGLLLQLAHMLGLESSPRRIESYDISNLGREDIVAAMVVFQDGRPEKRGYRRFKLRDMERQDDYGAIKQVLTRRFQHYLEREPAFQERPDLLLIDGGQQHVKVAQKVLAQWDLSIPVFGMVKDSRHRTRGLVNGQGEELGLQTVPALFQLVGRIQEETHRCAISFQRAQRKRKVQGSWLEEVPGVGTKRRNHLLRTFGSLQRMEEASLEELRQVVPQNVAQRVYQALEERKERRKQRKTGEEAMEGR